VYSTGDTYFTSLADWLSGYHSYDPSGTYRVSGEVFTLKRKSNLEDEENIFDVL
jgi:hypothetical protein